MKKIMIVIGALLVGAIIIIAKQPVLRVANYIEAQEINYYEVQ